MLKSLTNDDHGQEESALVEIAKGALPPTHDEWSRYDELRNCPSKLTETEVRELAVLRAKVWRLALLPHEIDAEDRLFAKYGPTTGKEAPRRAITNQQSVVERALAAAFYRHGQGVEQPF